MKKLLFLLVFAATIADVQAQNGEMYSLMNHNMEYVFSIENFMRQHDGDFIFSTFVAEQPEPGQWMGSDLGNIFYKMSHSSLTITDSLFVEDPNAPYYLFAPNPNGEGNIRANFEYHEDCDSTFLRICHFTDDNLNINHEEDILTPVCEGFGFGNNDSHMVDCKGDLIMKYCTPNSEGQYDEYIARFGSDGTLKHQALLFENQYAVVPKLRVFKESPLQYFQWKGYNNDNLAIILIDSLFNNNYVILNKILDEEVIDPYSTKYIYSNFSNDTEVIPIGGDDVLVAAQYTIDTNFHNAGEHGVAVVKYDLRTTQRKEMILFNDYAGDNHTAQCLGFKMMKDGTVYFMYKEVGYPSESIIIVKMDTNLNVEWKRFCKTDNINLLAPLYYPIMYEDNQGEEKGIAWAGYGKNNDEEVELIYFFLNHEGPVGMSEGSIEVRPYAFYPNPAKEQLHMQFSPDVKPALVELYDLQGRLVRTQGNNFESIDLSQLPVGTYTMRVTLENGEVYSDKMVKE